MIRVKTRVFLAMKNGISLSPKHDVIQPFIAASKAKRKTENKNN
jgi:hypothetical protein